MYLELYIIYFTGLRNYFILSIERKKKLENFLFQVQAAEELNAAKEEIKTVKNDLKSFYQKQLDAMLAERVSDYQQKLDSIVQITNEENKLMKLQMNNQMVNLKEKLENLQIVLKVV